MICMPLNAPLVSLNILEELPFAPGYHLKVVFVALLLPHIKIVGFLHD